MGKNINKEKNAPEVINVSVNEENLQDQQMQNRQIQDQQNLNRQIQGERNADLIPLEVNNGNVIEIENRQENIVAVEAARRQVRNNMPPNLAANVNANKEVKVEYRAKLPKDMVALLDEIAGWEKVKKDTSIPVKHAAEALKKANNDTDAADAMADLAVACAHYMQINGSKYFKSKRRKQVVTELMSKITGFISNADLVYYTSFEYNVDRLRENAADGKLEAKLSTFESELNSSLISANGVKTVEEAAAIMGERGLLRKECAEREAKRLAGFSDLSAEEKAELRPYTDEDRKRLYEKIKNDQKKDMTEEQFKIYVRATSTEPLLSCPEYHAKYNKVAGLFASYGANGTFSRDVSVALRRVNFDKNGKPMTKEDKANHDWNLKLLDAYEKDDYETREKMIAEECPHTYDKVEFPKIPVDKMKKYMAAKDKVAALKKNKNADNKEKEKLNNEIKELKNEIQKFLEDWIDDFVRNGDMESFYLANKKGLAFDQLKHVHSSMYGFLESNPLFAAKSEALGTLAMYMTLYTENTLAMCIGQSDVVLKYYENTEEAKQTAENHAKSNRAAMGGLLDAIIEQMLKVDEHKNDEIKPYVQCKDFEAEKKRLQESVRKKKAAVEEVRREREQKKQEEERKRLAAEQKKREEEEKKQAKKAAQEKAKRDAEEKARREAEEKKAKAEAEEKREREELPSKLRETVEKLNANTGFGTKEELEKILKSELTQDQQKKIKANVKVDLVPDLTVKEKKNNAGKLTKAVDAVTDMKIRLRDAVPIEIKKKIDYVSFSRLSDVAAMFGDETAAAEKLKELTGVFGESKRLADNVKRFDCKDEDCDKAGFYALDVLTAELMKLDVTSYDVRSDKAIAKNAAALEKMARGLESYRKLVDTLGGEAYFEHLKNRTGNGELFQKVFNHLGRLTVLSNYYRVKKAMMEDEYYIESEQPVSVEKNKDDIFEIERLRRLQNMAEAYSMTLPAAYKGDEKYEPREFVTFLNEQERAICKIEQERYMVAPKWMYSELSLTEQKDRHDDPDAVFILDTLGSGTDLYFMLEKYPKRESVNTDAFKVVRDIQSKQINKVFGGASKFFGGTDKYLATMNVGDDMNRSIPHQSFVLNYRRTVEETREMMELLNLQHTEYWETVKDDQEAVAYYESAYKEMAMRQVEAHYTSLKRVANTVGLKMLVMHPADLAMQYSARLKIEMLSVTSSTNIDTKDNMKMVERLFKENNKDGRFLFDGKDFSTLTGFVSNSGMKATNSGGLINKVARGAEKFDPDLDTDDVSIYDAEKKIFGKAGIINNEILEQKKKLQAKLDDLLEKNSKEEDIEKLEAIGKEIKDTAEAIDTIDKVGDSYYWLMKHPEVYSKKTFLSKGSNGKFIFAKQYREWGRNVYNAGKKEIKEILDNNLVKPLDEKELKQYEASLKKRRMPAYMLEGDIYGINLFRTKLDALIVKDKEGNVVKENGKIKFKNMDSLPEIDSVTGKPLEEG